MGVVCKQTLVLNECDKFDKLDSRLSSDGRGLSGKKGGAFLNYSLSAHAASLKLTFTEEQNFSSAALCFKARGKTRLFNIEKSKSGENARSFEFSFLCEENGEIADGSDGGVYALVVLNGSPAFFACRGAGLKGEPSCERRVFKELNDFYEENNKKSVGGCGAQKTSVLRGEKSEGETAFSYTRVGGKADVPNGGKLSGGECGGDGERCGGQENVCGDGGYSADERSSERANLGEYSADEKIEYNDEAIASENYYAPTFGGFGAKAGGAGALLNKIPLYAPEGLSAGGEVEDALQTSQNALFNGGIFSEQSQKTQNNEACGFARGDNCGENSDFYQKIESRIEALFSDYPQEPALSAVVPESRWVRVCYGENKFYVVGVIYNNGSPRYVCYGVVGDRLSPPAGGCSRAVFLPASLFERENKGFWCMLQNARTGKTEEF